VRIVYHPDYARLPLSAHVFPIEKYARTMEVVRRSEWFDPPFLEPRALSWEDLARVHTLDYLSDLRAARATPRTVRSELPVSRELIDGFLLMAGGTLAAGRAAMTGGVAAHIGGGFHHAQPGWAEGFCYVNDLACTLAALLAEGATQRPAVVDVDLHQGNGTAVVFADDPRVFTFSIHQREIYPIPKARSSLDVEVPAGTGDRQYLAALAGGLEAVFEGHRPDLILYQAGADPFREDQLGTLRLSREGLERRDAMVRDRVVGHQVPVVVTLGGGYARRVEDTVAIHVKTLEVFSACGG
jgi:acetoin utilization deacetylase AcuC-like enzyme